MARACLQKWPVKDRLEFYSMGEPNSGCTLWMGCVDKNGYGRLTVNFEDCKAHRLAYQEHIGPIPRGMVVCHKCDTPGCINPHHLFLGTHADNIADRDAKGRHVPTYGELNSSAKLDPAKVKAIRAFKGSQRQIAEMFGVCQQTISNIKRRKIWAATP